MLTICIMMGGPWAAVLCSKPSLFTIMGRQSEQAIILQPDRKFADYIQVQYGDGCLSMWAL
jgi:hypothetical protein